MKLLSIGCQFDYHINVTKSWLVVKEDCLASAQRNFGGMGIQIMSTGRPYLGAVLGSAQFNKDHT